MAFTSDVIEATLQLKKTIKRDLSGDIQFENMTSPAAAFASANTRIYGLTATNNTQINNGWNYMKPAQASLSVTALAYGTGFMIVVMQITAYVSLNGVSKDTATFYSAWFPVSPTDSLNSNVLGATPVAITSLQSSPNTLTNKLKLSIPFSSGPTYFVVAATADDAIPWQKNQNTTVGI